MAALPAHLRHAHHVGNPDPACEVCVEKAKERNRHIHQVDASAEQFTVRAVGGFVQTSGRFVR